MDQGGVGLGERILKAIFDSEVGILPFTGLTMQVLAYFERSSVEQVLYDLPRNKLKQNMKDMTFFLFELADQGDGVAIQIVREFATSISKYVAAGITKYGKHQSDMDVVLIGGLFKTKYPLLIDIITCEIHSVAPRARLNSLLSLQIFGNAGNRLNGLTFGKF
jgi:N-acetylglucosamine kinase-like BadF-type ATPase